MNTRDVVDLCLSVLCIYVRVDDGTVVVVVVAASASGAENDVASSHSRG